MYVDSPTDFVVDSRALPKHEDGKVTCTITNPSGNCTENLITPLADGTYRISYTPFEEGRAITFNDFFFNIINFCYVTMFLKSGKMNISM